MGNTSQTTYGVYAYEQSNVTVKNGTIAYCYRGISLEGNGSATTNSVDHVVDSMRLTYIYGFGAVRLWGRRLREPGQSHQQMPGVPGWFSGSSYAVSIICNSANITIQNNVVSSITATSSYGIYAAAGSFIRENTVSNCVYGVYGGKYQDNLTGSCTTPYSGGTDAGGNN